MKWGGAGGGGGGGGGWVDIKGKATDLCAGSYLYACAYILSNVRIACWNKSVFALFYLYICFYIS